MKRHCSQLKENKKATHRAQVPPKFADTSKRAWKRTVIPLLVPPLNLQQLELKGKSFQIKWQKLFKFLFHKCINGKESSIGEYVYGKKTEEDKSNIL